MQQAVGELDWKLVAARSAVVQIKGITAVADAAAVQLPFRARRGDDDRAATAAECLAWAGLMSADAIKVGIEDGWITLTGQVEWHCQRDLAEQSVRWIAGVVGVSNRTMIKPPVDGSDIGEELREALGQSWFCDPADILVVTDAGKVQLSGTVPSSLHRRVAGELAWAIRGVTAVENSIVVLDEQSVDRVHGRQRECGMTGAVPQGR